MRERLIRPRPKRAGRRDWIAALTLALVLGSVAPAGAVGPSTGQRVMAGTSIAFDLLIVRPLGLGELIFGFACFVPAALFAGPSVAEPWDLFVVEPFEATFTRPLGEFDDEY
jgi:hypothetical protein